MNHDEIIEVVQAHKDGKVIQFEWLTGPIGWISIDDDEPIWDFSTYHFRVKPEPKQCWVYFKPDGKPDHAVEVSGRDKSLMSENYRLMTEAL